MNRWLLFPSLLLAATLVAAQDRSSRAVEWPYYAGDPAARGTRR
jgi:hypothetical protein